mmetsp:Transcript_12474/g.39350  ORF Transcript_12474/g.39350 Transcript_12474/m.39350 type:complete len:237 (-) Transcript_12474:25-735(-)
MLLRGVSTCAPPSRRAELEQRSTLCRAEVLLSVLRALPPTSPARVAAVCRDWLGLLEAALGRRPWPVRAWDLEHPGVYMMGFRKRGLPALAGRGKMTFCAGDVPPSGSASYAIEWARRSGEPDAWQWCGWHRGRLPAGRWIRITVWVKFLERVPPASADFGIRVQGSLHNSWIGDVVPDVWRRVWVVTACVAGAPTDEVLLTFGSVLGPQVARFADLRLEVFGPAPVAPAPGAPDT